MTAVYVALIVVVPLALLQIIYLSGWRDEWFISPEDAKGKDDKDDK